ncbi:MAG: hypothetical protein KKB34_14170 [Bacteroidetes bacterium]|nr:hypothetical protein [Bacteroidota bacterium]
MLERIQEVNVETKFTGSRRNLSRMYGKGNVSFSKTLEQDSLSMSPAYKLASKFHLKIKDAVKTGDYYEIKFELNDFEFTAKIDLGKLYSDGKIILQGLRIFEFPEGRLDLEFWFEFTLDRIAAEYEIILESKILEKFTENIIDLGIREDFNIYNESSLETLAEGLKEDLTNELYNTCCIAIIFIEKLYDHKIIEKFGVCNEREKYYKLQLVKQLKY